MIYLLDTNVVSYFLQAGRERELAGAARTIDLVIVDEVRRELVGDPTRGGKAFERWLAGSNIAVRSIALGSPSAATLANLTSASVTPKDVGERASIALAMHESGLTLVTNDKGGSWLALRELWRPGETILGIGPFLRRIVDCGALADPNAVDAVMRHVQGSRPSWWADWRASLAGPGTA